MSLRKHNRINYYLKTSPQLRKHIDIKQPKETSFYTCHKASLTVEAAVVIPVVSAFFVTILFFFHVLHIQMRVEEGMIYAGRRTAVECSVVEDEVLQAASAKGFLLWEFREDELIERYVKGGSLGISILGSSFQGDRIILHATYHVKFPITVFGVDGITLWNRNVFRKWIGDMPQGEEDGETVVYVTPYGEVYHRLESCRALSLRVKKAFLWTMETMRGKNGQKYYACSRCVEKISNEDIVYYTDYGEVYHQRMNCGYIKRTVEKKQLSQVSDRRPCNLCCGGK